MSKKGGDMMMSGMNDMMKRLGQIEESCLGSRPDLGDSGETSDKFVQMKFLLTQDLTDMKMKIHDKFNLQKLNGASVEVIALTSQIRFLDQEITKKYEQLKEIYRKQCGPGFFGTNNIDQKELNQKYAQLDLLAHQIEEARKAFKTNTDSQQDETKNDRSKLGLGKGKTGDTKEGPKQHRTGEMDEFETQAVNRWQAAEREMDKGIDEVGKVVDRLRPLADEIGLQSQKQEKMMTMIKERTDKASTGMRQVSIRIRQIMDTEQKSTFACRLILMLILLALGVWIWERSKARSSSR